MQGTVLRRDVAAGRAQIYPAELPAGISIRPAGCTVRRPPSPSTAGSTPRSVSASLRMHPLTAGQPELIGKVTDMPTPIEQISGQISRRLRVIKVFVMRCSTAREDCYLYCSL